MQSDMDNEVQAEVVSDEDEEFIRNWSKRHFCYALAKWLATFDHAVETCETLNLREMI